MKCTGTNRQGGPCGNWAIKGGKVCTDHGGKAPQVKAKARERVIEARARQLLPETLQVHPNPLRRVLELAAEIDEFRAIILELVNGLSGWTAKNYETGGLDIRAEILVYERALGRASKAYVEIAKLNLEERLVRVQEETARAMLSALDKALAEAEMSSEQRQAVKGSTARHLRAVS